MEMLIEAANSMNPKQFELPRCISVPCVFPGTDKGKAKNPTIPKIEDTYFSVELPYSKIGRKSSKIRNHEKGPSGIIPLPAKKCSECSKSCRVAPLISCDFCELFYHLDCLDPPLTSPPSGRWMCPQHVEHFVVSMYSYKILNPISEVIWLPFLLVKIPLVLCPENDS